MLETLLIASASALFVSLGAHTLLLWDLRRALRHLELELAELQDDLLSEKRRRAAAASLVARNRTGLTPEDEALVLKARAAQPEDDAPWWSGLTKAQ